MKPPNQMQHSDFLKQLLLYGIGEMDAMRVGISPVQFRAMKKGTMPVGGSIYELIHQRSQNKEATH